MIDQQDLKLDWETPNKTKLRVEMDDQHGRLYKVMKILNE